MYVLNNSNTVQTEPIYRLAKQNQITQNISLWKGRRNENGQISLQSTNTTLSKPTLSDIDSAIVWMLRKDLHRKLPSLLNDVKKWIDLLSIYYPGSDLVKNFLHYLNEFMKNRNTLSSMELQNYVNSTSTIKLPDLKLNHCNGSDTTKRGYPCTLWTLFHSMTVKQALLAEQNKLPSNTKPSNMIVSIREFIRKFFLCEECAAHFINMTSNAENEIDSYKGCVLYLWRGHNKVNQRLRYDVISNDPVWPKVPFPTKQQCHLCVVKIDEKGDALEYDENETYNYLKRFYQLTNKADNQNYNHALLLWFFLFSFSTLCSY
ncbi:unnamed protein product [Rotaria sordida]|uniref:Sulfhydryl oxidase n=2 Tax=Rotaria sordida TaxID=392033 RepID=A0A814XNB0_9BILA|nr:unnamed protein product [Rotaria sordida]